MAEKKRITRKVISPSVKSEDQKVDAQAGAQESKEASKVQRKSCLFCQSKNIPSYTDTVTLKRFVSDRSKIVPKLKSNLCSKHQRAVTRQIKYARHLALLPFTPKV